MRSNAVDSRLQPIKNYAAWTKTFGPNSSYDLLGWRNSRWTADVTYTQVTMQTPDEVSGTAAVSLTWKTTNVGGRGFELTLNPEVGSSLGSATIPVQAGESITISAYLWHVSSTVTTSNVAMRTHFVGVDGNWLGTISGGTPINIINGWTRVSRTFIVPAGAVGVAIGAHIVSIVGTGTVGDIMYGTGLMLDRSPAVRRFYDGDSYGWKWLGTSGASQSAGYLESPNLIRNLVRYPDMRASAHSANAGTGGVLSGTAQVAISSSWSGYAWRSTWATAPTANDAFITTHTNLGNGPLVTASKTYMMSVWVSATFAATVLGVISWRNSLGGVVTSTLGSSVVLTPNTWTRLTVTAAAPDTAIEGGIRVRFASNSVLPGSGDYLQMAGEMFTEGSTLYEYADGNSPNWRWEGATGASVSVGYPDSPLLIRNLHTQPYPNSTLNNWAHTPGTGGGAASTASLASGFGSIPCSYRQTFTVLPTATRPNINSSVASNRVPATPGVEYTFSAYALFSWATTQPRILVQFFNSSGTLQGSTIEGPGITAVPNQWARYSATATAPATTSYVIAYVSSGFSYPAAIGDYYQATGFMMTVGSTLYEYSDGNTYGWRWNSGEGLSVSKGYPSTLESILGPNYLLDVAGDAEVTVNTALNWPTAPANNQPWTGFMVYDFVSFTATSTPSLLSIGETMDDVIDNSYSTLRVNSSASLETSTAIMRRTNGQGPTSVIGSLGRHMATFGIDASGYQLMATDGRTFNSQPIAMNYTPLYYRLQSSALVNRVRTVLVPGEISANSINAAEVWFANKYGVTISL